MSRFYPNDFLQIELLRKLGGSTQIKLPASGLTADEWSSLRNACMVPGIKAVFSGEVLVLSLVPEDESAVRVDGASIVGAGEKKS
jgi:hypothetical protein